MDDLRSGAALRAIGIRRRLRQSDVAKRAGLSSSAVSRIERGRLDEVTLETIRRVAKAIDVRVELVARWRGGELDRLLPEPIDAASTHTARCCDTLSPTTVGPCAAGSGAPTARLPPCPFCRSLARGPVCGGCHLGIGSDGLPRAWDRGRRQPNFQHSESRRVTPTLALHSGHGVANRASRRAPGGASDAGGLRCGVARRVIGQRPPPHERAIDGLVLVRHPVG